MKHFSRVVFLAASTALCLTVSTWAVDDLRRYASLFNQSTDPIAFEYKAPSGGFGPETGFPVPLMNLELAETLLQSEGYDPVTGVDFSKVTSAITLGQAPNAISILHGSPGYADDHVAAISARGFDRHMLGDIAVYSEGADNFHDMTQARAADAFGYGMGMAQRLANPGDDLIITRNWATMEKVLAHRDAKPKAANPWLAIFDALDELKQTDHLEGAIGWQDEGARGAMAAQGYLPYRAMLASLELAGDQPILRTMMLFEGSRDEALPTIENVRAESGGLAQVLGTLETDIVEGDGYVISVLSIVVKGDINTARQVMQLFSNDAIAEDIL